MTDEKHFEAYADRLIREAVERGEFDDLPGEGRPISSLEASYDPAWWARRLLARERGADLVRQARAVRRIADADDRAAAIAELQRRLDAVNAVLPETERLPPIEA